ncbi:glutathione S-transferase [Melaminivora sp.]
MLTLYDCASAPSPRRARIFLAEKGLAYDTVPIDLRQGEQFGPAYRRINPDGTVPALQTEEGLLLTDNAAIAAYLEARYPEPPLLGRSPAEQAAIASWNWRMEFDGLLAVAEALRNSSPAMAGRALPGPIDYAQIPALAERGRARIGHFFDHLNERLQGREFIASEQFSVADITAVVALDFARIVQCQPQPQHQALLRWRAALGQRPSIGQNGR